MTTRNDRRNALKRLAGASLGLSLAPLLSGCAPGVVRSRSARRPNIVFIMTDDHARSAMSLYGNAILQTPNLDRIGNEGLRFDQAFVTNSLCLPSRATFLTGQYSHTHGMRTNGEEAGFTREPPLRNAQTWPLLLRSAGYHTGMVGKWHINTLPEGYDYTAMIRGQGTYFDPEMWVQGQWRAQRGHTDDVIGEHALRFVKEAPRDRPFALLYQFKAPHRDWNPAPRFRDHFEDVEIPLPPSFEESLEARSQAVRGTMMRIAEMPDFRKGKIGEPAGEALAKANFQQFMRNYYRVLLGVDENIGRFLDHLAHSGMAEDTLVVYTTDNGFFLGEHGLFDKRLMYEPSIRIPLLLRWPGGMEAGRVDDTHFALNIDLAPTLLDLGGATIPHAMQGESWRPLIERRATDWRQDFLYEYYEYPGVHCVRPHRGVRNARWKLIEFWREPSEYELYDLQADPQERNNLAHDPAHAQTLSQLRARLAELRARYDDHDPPDYLPEQQQPQQCHYGG